MRKVLEVLNDLVESGILGDYAIGGAVGVMFYTEPFHTKDIDVFVVPYMTDSGIVHLEPVYSYLKKKGYSTEGQYVRIGRFLVDFVSVYDALTEEGLKKAVKTSYEGVKTKVFRPEHLLAIALKAGRIQDLIKVERLYEQASLDKQKLLSILKRHGLYRKWQKFLNYYA